MQDAVHNSALLIASSASVLKLHPEGSENSGESLLDGVCAMLQDMTPMTFALPARRHIPGTTSVPDRAPLDAIKALTPPRITVDSWRDAPAYAYGLHLHAHGYFWEAHEVWEAVWLATAPNSQERHLLAGLIQLANACLKLEMVQPKAALRLLQASQDHLAECRSGALLGLDPAALVHDIAAFAHQVAVLDDEQELLALIAQRPKPALAGAHSTAPD
jgi:hypothetical protein